MLSKDIPQSNSVEAPSVSKTDEETKKDWLNKLPPESEELKKWTVDFHEVPDHDQRRWMKENPKPATGVGEWLKERPKEYEEEVKAYNEQTRKLREANNIIKTYEQWLEVAPPEYKKYHNDLIDWLAGPKPEETQEQYDAREPYGSDVILDYSASAPFEIDKYSGAFFDKKNINKQRGKRVENKKDTAEFENKDKIRDARREAEQIAEKRTEEVSEVAKKSAGPDKIYFIKEIPKLEEQISLLESSRANPELIAKYREKLADYRRQRDSVDNLSSKKQTDGESLDMSGREEAQDPVAQTGGFWGVLKRLFGGTKDSFIAPRQPKSDGMERKLVEPEEGGKKFETAKADEKVKTSRGFLIGESVVLEHARNGAMGSGWEIIRILPSGQFEVKKDGIMAKVSFQQLADARQKYESRKLKVDFSQAKNYDELRELLMRVGCVKNKIGVYVAADVVAGYIKKGQREKIPQWLLKEIEPKLREELGLEKSPASNARVHKMRSPENYIGVHDVDSLIKKLKEQYRIIEDDKVFLSSDIIKKITDGEGKALSNGEIKSRIDAQPSLDLPKNILAVLTKLVQPKEGASGEGKGQKNRGRNRNK